MGVDSGLELGLGREFSIELGLGRRLELGLGLRFRLEFSIDIVLGFRREICSGFNIEVGLRFRSVVAAVAVAAAAAAVVAFSCIRLCLVRLEVWSKVLL